MIDVWARRANMDRALDFVAVLHAKGEAARATKSESFRSDQWDSYVTRAYHDGTHRGIAEAYELRGVPVDIIPGVEVSRVDDLQVTGWEIVERGAWLSVVGPDGKHGKSVRTREEAEALMETARARRH